MQDPGCQADSASFVIRITRHGPVLFVAGELDCANEALLTRSVESLGRLVDGPALVDLTGVTMLSSAAIHGLIAASRHLGPGADAVRVIGASRLAARVIELCGLAEYFHLAPARVASV